MTNRARWNPRPRGTHALLIGLLLVALGCPDRDPVPPPEGPDPGRPPAPGRAKFTPSLEAYFARAPDEELVPVVFVMHRQLTREEKAGLFAGAHALERSARLAAQRESLVQALEELARNDQQRLLGTLEKPDFRRRTRDVRSLWLSNVIGLHGTESAVEELASFEEVASVHLDLPRPAKGELDVAWGVSKTRADQVWSLPPMGWDGTGSVVAILDTGVDYHHPAFAGRMWVNEPEDKDKNGVLSAPDLAEDVDDDGNGTTNDVNGYDFSGSGSPDPKDGKGHGTHVAGTVAGAEAGRIYGVAPGAKIMALKESSSSTESTQKECWAAMQYALKNGADVVNFSSGWAAPWNPIDETWRDAIENLMDGGTLFVTISHNDGNVLGAPYNVRTPGNVPLAVTVGATRRSETVPSFSNRGPVSWQKISRFFDYPYPPGLTKPDVVAPGVAIKSARLGGGFVTYGGTSYAAPHVAGIAALLRQSSPGITAYELKYVLEETAVDLGTPGPDNDSGWGRVDALAAVTHELSLAPYDLDIGSGTAGASDDIWIDNDDDGVPDAAKAWAANHVYARVRNLGGSVVAKVQLEFFAAKLGTLGAGSFDPDGDGDPSDGPFEKIGTYEVPTFGPSGSLHDTATGVVHWNPEASTDAPSALAVRVQAPADANLPEGNTANNLAVRSQVQLYTSLADVPFEIVPPPAAPTEPFAFEIAPFDLPRGTTVWIAFDRSLEPVLVRDVIGLLDAEESVASRKAVDDAFREALHRQLPYVRRELKGGAARFDRLQRPDGSPLPVRLVIDVPHDAPRPGSPRLELRTLDGAGLPTGTITLRLARGVPSQKGGPYLPEQ